MAPQPALKEESMQWHYTGKPYREWQLGPEGVSLLRKHDGKIICVQLVAMSRASFTGFVLDGERLYGVSGEVYDLDAEAGTLKVSESS